VPRADRGRKIRAKYGWIIEKRETGNQIEAIEIAQLMLYG